MNWHPRLATEAERDLANILEWTRNRFGDAQARVYRDTIRSAIRELQQGPSLLGVKRRDELMAGLMSLHVARNRRRGRHLILFRIDPREESTIEILRILHDTMDFSRHLPKAGEDAP